MKRLATAARSRSGLLVLMLTLIAGALSLHPAAQAQSCVYQPLYFIYYDDAAHDNIVGESGTDCDCNSFSWGTTSPYKTVNRFCCSFFTC